MLPPLEKKKKFQVMHVSLPGFFFSGRGHLHTGQNSSAYECILNYKQSLDVCIIKLGGRAETLPKWAPPTPADLPLPYPLRKPMTG